MATKKTDSKTPRRFGTRSTYSTAGRLIKDAEAFEIPGKEGPVRLVTLTLVDNPDDDRYLPLFPEVTVGGNRVDFLGTLKKGAVVRIEGKPGVRVYERNTPRSTDISDRVGVALEIRYPRVVEVLWTPGREGDEEALPTEGSY